jgi:diadenylate cyclase
MTYPGARSEDAMALTIPAVHWQSAVDFFVLAVALYLLLRWSRQARALRLALSILALRVGALLARQLELLITSWVLDVATGIAILALLVVFQPELRRALMRLDIRDRGRRAEQGSTVSAVATAVWSLAQARCGALIVLARRDSLAEMTTSGIALNGQVSPEILVSLFQKESPVHDGAAIIEGDVIARVGAILPLTARPHVPKAYGTRHRAGLGLAERSDALIVVVSEERGEVTVMWETHAQRLTTADELVALLRSVIHRVPDQPAVSRRAPRLAQLRLQAIAFALAALVWGVTFLFPGRSVRVRSVPIEFTNVPSGLIITGQSAETLEVWLRGNQFLFDTVDLETVQVRCDLSSAHAGVNAIPIRPAAVDAPFGIKVEAMSPRQVTVRLLSASAASSQD